MTLHLAEQPVLKTVQGLLRSGFALPVLRRHRSPKIHPRAEVLHRQMLDIGDLLIDALRLEHDASHDGSFERWRSNRTMVDGIAQDYASAMAAWREAVEEEHLPAELGLSIVD